ncbi:MAG: hypothetical protein R3250_00295 [Melioribacteraceae bacterium]|nr:hypothetical protein [Melioribacteraceae bacterium]
MQFETYSFRHAEVLLREPEFNEQGEELLNIISNLSEDEIIEKHRRYGIQNIEKTPKSVSSAINALLKERLVQADWSIESPIFQDPLYSENTWRLDFAKKDISIEVAFNHSTVIAWNLIKPVLASELNHVQKAIQTRIGIIITVTEDMKRKGGFDGAIGTYEQFQKYLPTFQNLLPTPILLIGLRSPETFEIEVVQHAPRKKIGIIKMVRE